jgi:MFS family permease
MSLAYLVSLIGVSKVLSDDIESDIGNLSTAFNTGLTIGAFTWGLLVDILGVSSDTEVQIYDLTRIEKVVLQHHLYLCICVWVPLCR